MIKVHRNVRKLQVCKQQQTALGNEELAHAGLSNNDTLYTYVLWW